MRILRNIPAQLQGNLIDRKENCRMCNESKATQLAVVDYWDIKTSNIVKCSRCNLIQLDPMLTIEETSKGCLAYYIEESLRVSKKEQARNLVRSFRRGVIFGYKLKRRKTVPEMVLELGPGSGYFSAGLQFVFPEARITVMDINKEVLTFNKEQHGFETIQEVPDNFVSSCSQKFDMVIAQDILEHVTDISKVVDNINNYLVPNGLFHFITPNGHEDVWKHYLTEKLKHKPSELLINHVNYFDGKGLKEFLIKKGFSPIDYYTYKIKTTIRGQGWKHKQALMNPVSKKTSADFYIKEKADEARQVKFDKKDILSKWYIRHDSKWVTYWYCLYQHASLFKLSPELNVGHEIYGLYNKVTLDK